MARAVERHVDALLRPLGQTGYLGTGTVLAVLHDGALAVQLDGGRGPVIAWATRAEPPRPGAHVLVERVAADRCVVHGTIPEDLVIG